MTEEEIRELQLEATTLRERCRLMGQQLATIRHKADAAVGVVGNADGHRKAGADGAVDYLIAEYITLLEELEE